MPRSINPQGFGFLVNDLSRLFRTEFERQFHGESAPVTPAEARVLAHLARLGAARQVRLAESMRISPMSLCDLLDKLEAAGLVARGDDPADRRAKIVDLTPAADAVLEAIRSAARRCEAVAGQGISAADWEAFHRIGLAIRSNLDEARR